MIAYFVSQMVSLYKAGQKHNMLLQSNRHPRVSNRPNQPPTPKCSYVAIYKRGSGYDGLSPYPFSHTAYNFYHWRLFVRVHCFAYFTLAEATNINGVSTPHLSFRFSVGRRQELPSDEFWQTSEASEVSFPIALLHMIPDHNTYIMPHDITALKTSFWKTRWGTRPYSSAG